MICSDFDLYKTPLFIIKKLQLSLLKRYSGYLKGKLLDIGCGNKPYKKFLECTEYVGLDTDEKVSPDIVGDVTNLPFEDETFDSILCTEVLEHIPDITKALQEMYRVLRKDGNIYLTVPMYWCLHYEPNDYYRFTKYGLKYLLENTGFTVEKIERIGGIFSLIGVRMADVIWTFLVNFFSFSGKKNAERIATFVIFPFSIFFYFLGKIGDNIDKRDTIGWMIICKK